MALLYPHSLEQSIPYFWISHDSEDAVRHNPSVIVAEWPMAWGLPRFKKPLLNVLRLSFYRMVAPQFCLLVFKTN